MPGAFFLLFLLASATHPKLRRLETLAVQHFGGAANTAAFMQMNRHLEGSSGNDGDIVSMCNSQYLTQFCEATDQQLDQYMAISANDGATTHGNSQLCALKVMKGFYCNALCTVSCQNFLGPGGGGEALGTSSSNDESAAATPAFMMGDGDVHNVCSSSCLTELLKSMSAMMQGLASCGEADLSTLSSNDDAIATVSSATSGLPAAPGSSASVGAQSASANQISGISDPTAQFEDLLGKMCVRNGEDRYCLNELSAFTEMHPERPVEISCATPAVKDLVGLGCCFGSMVTMAQAADGGTSSSDDGSRALSTDTELELAELSYWVTKCGGTVVPCSAGALQDTAVVSSSLSLSVGSPRAELEAALEEPAALHALQNRLGGLLGSTAVLVNTIAVSDSTAGGAGGGRHLRAPSSSSSPVPPSSRSLSSSSSAVAVVGYSVLVGADEADTVQGLIQSVDDASLTDALNAEAAFEDIPVTSAQQSETVTTEISKASPDGSNAGVSIAPSFAAVFVVASIAIAGAPTHAGL